VNILIEEMLAQTTTTTTNGIGGLDSSLVALLALILAIVATALSIPLTLLRIRESWTSRLKLEVKSVATIERKALVELIVRNRNKRPTSIDGIYFATGPGQMHWEVERISEVEREGAALRYTPAGSLRIKGDDTRTLLLEFSLSTALERSRIKCEVTVETTHKTHSVRIPSKRFFDDYDAYRIQHMYDLLRAQREQSKGADAAG